jgi:hypothetical protein
MQTNQPLPKPWCSPHEAAQPEKARFVDGRQRVHCSPALNKTALQKQQGSE